MHLPFATAVLCIVTLLVRATKKTVLCVACATSWNVQGVTDEVMYKSHKVLRCSRGSENGEKICLRQPLTNEWGRGGGGGWSLRLSNQLPSMLISQPVKEHGDCCLFLVYNDAA